LVRKLKNHGKKDGLILAKKIIRDINNQRNHYCDHPQLKVVRDIEIDESELIGEENTKQKSTTSTPLQTPQINMDCPIKYTFCKSFLQFFNILFLI
jgi:hypothetical protein